MELLRRMEKETGLSVSESDLFRADTVFDLLMSLKPSALEKKRSRFHPTQRERTTASLSDTLTGILALHAREDGDRVHIRLDQDIIRYEELLRRAEDIAAGIQAAEIDPGDRVALMLPTEPNYFPAFFGNLQRL